MISCQFEPIELSKIAEVFSGFAFKSEDLGDFDIPVVKIKNINGKRVDPSCDQSFPKDKLSPRLEKYFLRSQDILVAMTGQGSLGRFGRMYNRSSEYLVNQRVGIVRVFDEDECSPDYLYHVLSMDIYEEQLFSLGVGAGQPNVSSNDIGKLVVPRVHIVTQKKIAAILSTYDDLIENNKRRIALLEKMAEEIYREWFVRFRFPGYQDAEFEKGIPKGWGEIKFGEFCTLKRGYDLPDSLVVAGEYPVIASTSVKTYHKQYKVKPPVVTTGRSGSLGTVLISHKSSWPLNTTLYVKDYRGNNPYLVFYTLKGMQLEQFNAGAGVPSLNRNHLNGLKLANPPKDVQSQFNSLIEPIFQQIWKLDQSVELLVTIKNLLLPRLISGKLSVEDLDIKFPPSMEEVAE